MAAEKEKVIKWEGSLGIEQAETLKEELLNAFKESKNILLNLSNVEDVDTTTIQLIFSARKEAEKQGINFGIDEKIPPVAANLLKLLNLPLIKASKAPTKKTSGEE